MESLLFFVYFIFGADSESSEDDDSDEDPEDELDDDEEDEVSAFFLLFLLLLLSPIIFDSMSMTFSMVDSFFRISIWKIKTKSLRLILSIDCIVS